MTGIENMLKRVSVPKLTEPGPDENELNTLIECALRAPDHGMLRPWRFVVIEGDARNRLGEVFVEAKKCNNPHLSKEEQDKIRQKPLRAPLIIVAIARIIEHEKIPEIEMTLSMGAAVEHIMLAAHEMGYGAMWRTGAMAYDPYVLEQLGGNEKDQIIGFIYLGTIIRVKNLPELAVKDFTEYW